MSKVTEVGLHELQRRYGSKWEITFSRIDDRSETRTISRLTAEDVKIMAWNWVQSQGQGEVRAVEIDPELDPTEIDRIVVRLEHV